jgi:hypothetical protein
MTLFYGVKEIREDMERVERQMEDPRAIFVFGSNERGIHGAGAAKVAREKYGAKMGQGVGLFGRSYALPTVWYPGVSLAPYKVGEYVQDFIGYARVHQELVFVVTRVGCGLAGFTDTDIAPMFKDASDNCLLPDGWREYANR